MPGRASCSSGLAHWARRLGPTDARVGPRRHVPPHKEVGNECVRLLLPLPRRQSRSVAGCCCARLVTQAQSRRRQRLPHGVIPADPVRSDPVRSVPDRRLRAHVDRGAVGFAGPHPRGSREVRAGRPRSTVRLCPTGERSNGPRQPGTRSPAAPRCRRPRSEWRLITATHILLKLHRHQLAIVAAGG